MVKPMHEQSASVKLLTILNVQSAKPPASATKKSTSQSTAQPAKPVTRDWHQIAQRAAKRTKLSPKVDTAADSVVEAAQLASTDDDHRDEALLDEEDAFRRHFASDRTLVTESSEEPIEWDRKRTAVRGIGLCQLSTPKHATTVAPEPSLNLYNSKLLDKLRSTHDDSIPAMQTSWLECLSTYQDLNYSKLELGEAHDHIKSAVSLHAMNHVL
ncbi:uncharacterized protein JCM15063_000820, partial [Sporobolomyces koalae]|uniref:uncharacterized protein n=1 Tax=Sporobolomyces koalae TaxID=500713 RepID=UPI00317308BB